PVPPLGRPRSPRPLLIRSKGQKAGPGPLSPPSPHRRRPHPLASLRFLPSAATHRASARTANGVIYYPHRGWSRSPIGTCERFYALPFAARDGPRIEVHTLFAEFSAQSLYVQL